MSEVQNREDTAEFLKAQLRVRHPDSAFVPDAPVDRLAEERERKRLAKQARREAEMRRKAADAAARFAKSAEQLEREQIEQIAVQNDNMRILLMLASAA